MKRVDGPTPRDHAEPQQVAVAAGHQQVQGPAVPAHAGRIPADDDATPVDQCEHGADGQEPVGDLAAELHHLQGAVGLIRTVPVPTEARPALSTMVGDAEGFRVKDLGNPRKDGTINLGNTKKTYDVNQQLHLYVQGASKGKFNLTTANGANVWMHDFDASEFVAKELRHVGNAFFGTSLCHVDKAGQLWVQDRYQWFYL